MPVWMFAPGPATVPHHAGAPVGRLQVLDRGKKRRDFDLDCLRQKLLRARSQDIRQWIVDLVGLTKRHNVSFMAYRSP
ncbi:hypothetical protein ABH973_000713 [Bradyrhizobium ottawaense]